MRERARRVVVTGIGTINPLGHSVDESWTAALAGKSGSVPSPSSIRPMWPHSSLQK